MFNSFSKEDRIVLRTCTALAAFLAGGLAFSCAAEAQTVVGLHTVSYHWTDEPRNNVNPGVYVRFGNGVVAGTYRNSYDRNTVYAGWSWVGQPVNALTGWETSITFALATGYQRRQRDGSTAECQRAGLGSKCLFSEGFSRYVVAPLIAPAIATPVTAGWRLRLSGMPRLGSSSSAVVHLSIEKVLP